MTVTQGTARSLSTLPVTVAGKTGTAQFDSANPAATRAVYSFRALRKSRIVITVLIEAGGEGSSAASPLLKKHYYGGQI